MNDLASLTNQTTTIRIAVTDDDGNPTGEILEYKVHPLTYNDWGKIQAWVNDQFPNPFDTARDAITKAAKDGRPYNIEQEKFLLKNAAELALKPRNLIGTPETTSLLFTIEGSKHLLLNAIHDPDFTPEKAERLLKYMTPMDIVKIELATQLNMVIDNPKAEPLNGNSTKSTDGSSASRRTRRAAKAKGRRTTG